jgi:hypothetical protein
MIGALVSFVEIAFAACDIELLLMCWRFWMYMLLRCAVLLASRRHRRRPLYRKSEELLEKPCDCCCVCLEELEELKLLPAQFIPCMHAVCCLPCTFLLDSTHAGPGTFRCPVCRGAVAVVHYYSSRLTRSPRRGSSCTPDTSREARA